jgi:parallel beta-helix repeat protein
MVDVKIKIALVLIAIMILAAPIAIAQEVPAHVVISEVQIATNEFVELYNPTNTAINMTGWHWCYFSSGRNWNESHRDKTFPDEAIIPAHGFYLIGLKGFPEPSSDWQVYSSTQLANSGSVGIFPWDPDTKTAEEAKAGKIDAVGWGSVTYVYETATASTPGSGESIEREPLKDGYAPCQDTDDNSVDFFVQDAPTPKNSLSPEMDPAPVELFDADGNFEGSFVNIQDAVDNASDGYTIRVDDGTYNENLAVAKQLTICSEHGAASTTVSASDSDDNVIAVTAAHVTISGFNVAGATQQAGIYLCNADYCNISNNSASNNKIGIHLQMGSQHNTIINNTVSDNEDGISLSSSDDNSIYNNKQHLEHHKNRWDKHNRRSLFGRELLERLRRCGYR